MPLSTSNSDSRMQANHWVSSWIATALCVFLMLGGWEIFWRQKGFTPAVSDSPELWALGRRKASNLDQKGMVLLGSSRIQMDFHPDVFERLSGVRPIMLAIDGSSPLPVLRHLGEDPNFNSRVIVSLIPMFLAEPLENERAGEWVKDFEEQKWSSRIETRFSVFVQQNLAFRSASLAPDEIWTHLKQGRRLSPTYAPMRADRYRPGLFSRADVKAVREGRFEREREIHASAKPLSREKFLKRIEQINAMVEKIRRRGGEVVFVRLPSSGLVRELENRTWPRERYWDLFAERTSADTYHFEDYPCLQGFHLPDGSHMSLGEAKRFTGNLVKILF